MPVDATIDLRIQFGPARDQKQRPTCMAFAASDTHGAARGNLEFLSTEFAHFHAVRRKKPFDPLSGVSFKLMAQSIHQDGQPPEAIWPYLPALPASLGEWKPPNDCKPIFRRQYQIEQPSIEGVYEYLRNSRPVVITMTISSSFFRPSQEGVINGSLTEPALNSHAVIAVGYGTNQQSRAVLVRNSWGDQWGLRGHAWITEEYLQPRMLKIGTADLKES
jgi:Papain family cysteine protease